MRNLFLCILVFVTNVFCKINTDFKLPRTWTKDFKIILYTSPGMRDEAVDITYTYDSCKYVKREGTVKKTTAFALTEAKRAEILKKLYDLKIDQIKEKKSPKKPVMDESSSGICFYEIKEFCLSGGQSTQDSKNYALAYSYLWDLAEPKKK